MTAADTSHECPGPGCNRRVPRDMLACRRHWYQVSAATRARVWRAYRGDDAGTHAEAITAAIAEMKP